MVLSNPGTQNIPLSAGIAQEPVPMASRLMAETFGFAPAQTAASSWTARRSSVVVVAIDLACAGVAHKARGALSGLSGQRHGRRCRVRATSSADARRRPDLVKPNVTLMYQ